MQKYLSASVYIPIFCFFLFSVTDVFHNKFLWTVWLLTTNEIFISLAHTVKCKFLTIPDWLKFRNEGKDISQGLQLEINSFVVVFFL